MEIGGIIGMICAYLVIGILIGIFIEGCYFYQVRCETFNGEMLPHALVEDTELNWFGAVLVSIALFILFPLIWIFSSLRYACTKH